MDISDLERTASSLERSLGKLEAWLEIATFVVVIGLIIELWHEIPDAIKELRKAKKILWKPVCTIVGGSMITVGVAGELFVEFMASSKQTALRKVNAEISDAFKNATERDHLAVLKAETLANESRTVAEREQIARLRLEERVAPRRLTPEVRAKLIAAVKGHASAAPIEINSSMSDAESGEFSAMLRDALKDAGWKFSGGSLVAWDSPAPRAVTVAINPADVNSSAITNAAVALQRALYSIGFAIDPQAKSDRNAGVGIIRLIVGFKPEK